MKSDYLIVSDKVEEAISNKLPVIAIDTAGIYLGLSGSGLTRDGIGSDGVKKLEGDRPDLAKIVEDVEKLIVQNGAVPATTAIVDGQIHVGLDKELRQYLADNQESLQKVSRRNLPVVLALGEDGVTTVSSTMMIAQMVGIQVVMTVGIGGVSEDHGDSLDVSSDLEELIRNQIVVVCSGTNPGVDPRKSMEYLETHGVPVIGFRSDKFYTKWCQEKENPLSVRVDEPTDIARVHAVKRSLDITGSMLVINPVADDRADAESFDVNQNEKYMVELLHDNATLAAWIAMAISMDLDPAISNKNSKRSSKKKQEKSMSFEVWLFSVKGFAQNFDVAQLIFNNLPDSEKERLRQEYEDTVD